MRHKGFVQDIKYLVLGLIAVGVLLIIISPGIRNSFTSIFNVADKYGAPKLEFTNNYMFTAESVSIDLDTFENKCKILELDKVDGLGSVYECQKGMPVDFLIIMKNDGYKMRTFYGGIVVCKSGDKDCCGNSKTLATTGTDDCALVPGDLKGCTAGTYTFDDQYDEYEVHPVADCIMDSTYGCYDAGITTSVKSCNPDEYITIKIVDDDPTLASP